MAVLAAYNNIASPNIIQAGVTIKIPPASYKVLATTASHPADTESATSISSTAETPNQTTDTSSNVTETESTESSSAETVSEETTAPETQSVPNTR